MVWFQSPWPAALLIYVGNALEATAGAWLVNRISKRPGQLETLQEVLAFVALAAGFAPVVSATVGSATLAWFAMQSQTFTGAWPLWWIGDATGVLIVAPLGLVVFQNWRGRPHLSIARWIEVCVLGLIFLGTAALSLSGLVPFAYIIMPPLLWVAVRFEFKGAAIALTLLALITAVFTVIGAGEFAGDPGALKHHQITLQLFLGISAFSALIVAAISRQHQSALLTLRQSVEALRDRERELSLLVDMVPSHVWRLTPEGEPTFFNKRMVDFLGLNIADLGRPGVSRLEAVIETVHPDDAAAFGDSLHRCLDTGESFAMRYRLRRADGVYHWMSSRADPRRDERGRIVQWYGLCHDIDDQVHAEEALRRSERQLQEMVDAVPVRIWSATPAGGIVYFNKRYQDHFRSVIPAFDTIDKSRIENLLKELVHPEDAPQVERTMQSCFESGGTSAMRFRWREKDGTYRWAECRVGPRRDQDGAIAQWYGVSLDIDDEMRAQQALRDSERELSQLVAMVPGHVWRLSPDGEPVFFNKQMVDFLGMKVADTDRPGMSRLQVVVETVHPDDAPQFRETLHQSLVTGESFAMRYRLRGADGIYRWMSGRAEPMRDESGRIVQWFGLSHDIDDQMRLQREIEEREARIRRLVDSDIIGIVIWDLDGTLIDANDAFLRMVQYDRDELKAGLDWLAMTPPEWQAVHAREEAEELMTTGKMQAREKEYFRKDGSRVPVLIGGAFFEGQSKQGVAYILDLTELKRAEAALRHRERELQQLVDAMPVHVWSWTPDGRLAYLNKRSLEELGLTGANFEDRARVAQMLIHPDDAPEVLRTSLNCLETGDPFIMRYRRRWKDGNYRWMEGRCEPLRDRDGTIVQWYQVSIDIDDQMHAQEALRERERFLWHLVETLPAMIDCAAPDGEPVYRSKQLREFLGYELEALDGTGKSRLTGTLEAGVHPDDVAGVKEQYARSLATGEPYARRHRLRRFDGEYRWVETRAAPMRNAEGAIVQWNVICLDIDGEVRMQEQLRLAQENLARQSQAASLAELCASIAHEVNQPLAAVVANSHACQRWLKAEPPNLERALKTVERVIRDANAAADVVSHIRALFRQSVGTGTTAKLSDVIAEARDLMAEEATRRRISMSIDVESNLPPVALGRVQIQQVLVNLIRNGMDAMDTVANERVLRMRVRRREDVVQTEVSDHGPGVEFPDKIFQPFFTTKEQGMGMGLAICRSIVESHGGRLWAETNEPRGAKFIFTLPVETNTAS
ncbi:PAS/PAC sensor signal transduction histidine kinase [Mesorhizobium loti]|nr:PAS/PAC sensor signal transduction histidine kinase [Mesorhizobium loti]